eukprot:5453900-Amphidinium_carterae.2
MDECTMSVTVVQMNANGYDDFMDLTVNIKKMRSDIVSFSQTLNYVLLHATKPGCEAHSITRREATEFNNFCFFCAVMHLGWNSDTRQFTKQCHIWLEDINRYESENGQGTVMKIATHQWISNYFNSTYTGTNEDNEGQVGGVNNYDDENYDNEEYYDEENEENWDYDNNHTVTIAFMKGKAKGQRKGKAKEKERKETISKAKTERQ